MAALPVPPRTALVNAVISDPPLPLVDILAAGSKRVARVLPPEGAPSLALPDIPSLHNRKPYLLLDAVQQRDALWGGFQSDLRYRMLHRNDPPPPPEPKEMHKSMRGPRVVRPPPVVPPEPTDWTGKVALELHKHMKKAQSRVKDIFERYDTDGSQSLDASEFYYALIELGIPEALKMPEAEIGNTLQEVFDTMDDDGNGVLSFKEINHYLRAGRHEVVLDKSLQSGAVQVHDTVQQTHRLRRKEEWKALERFEALDVDMSGDASIRELHAFFISEGYSEHFVRSLMGALDVDLDGTLSAEEWRKGVAELKGSSLLMSMTDPMEPPSGENFKDLTMPKEALPFGGYEKQRAGTSLTPVRTYQTGKVHRGCEIENIEDRGTKISQLRAICDHISRRCDREKWVDIEGDPLEAKKVTLYDTAAYVVKPATRKKRNSLMEVISRGPQPPKWFVSHWWGMSLFDLLTCLEQHTSDRRLDLNATTYWLSVFAFSLWKMRDTDLQLENPLAAPMRRAMEVCDGTVSVVDPGAVYWGRIWCVYEVAQALELSAERDATKVRSYSYDIYTPHVHKRTGVLVPILGDDDTPTGKYHFSGGVPSSSSEGEGGASSWSRDSTLRSYENTYAVGVTDGPVACDRDVHVSRGERESHFPTGLFAPALGVKVQSGSASVEADKTYILNVLRARGEDVHDFHSRPPVSHAKYTELNAAVRGYCAKSALVRSVVDYCKGQPDMFASLLEGLQESTVQRIDLSFELAVHEGLTVPGKVFEQLLDALPPSIEHLVIELPKNVTRLPPNKLKGLQNLHTLELRKCHGLEELPDDLVECFKLQTLEMTELHALHELPKRMFEMTNLTSLIIANCPLIKQMHARGVAKAKLETLILRDCTGLLMLADTLGNTLANLHTLMLRGCTSLQAIPSWVADMERNGVAVQRPYHLE